MAWAVITQPDPGQRRAYRDIGWKHGTWPDVLWLLLPLGDRAAQPGPIGPEAPA